MSAVAAASGGELSYGVDIGGTKVLGLALDAAGRDVAEARVPTPGGPAAPGHEGEEVAAAVARVVEELDAATAMSDVPVGVGVPGMLDLEGRLRFSPNLPQGHRVSWRTLLEPHMAGRPFVVENDANMAALAELRLGAAKGARAAWMVTLGTGIGGGLILDGKVQVGAHGFAGEIGHMVVDPAGPPCPCGRHGCWERYASGAGLGLLARQAALAGNLPEVVARAGGDPEAVRGEDVTAAARAGDGGARRVLERVGWWVGFGLANLAAVVDPECFVLGGGLVGAGEALLESARQSFDELVEGGRARPTTRIVAAAFGERAGAVGAAVAARQGGLD